MQHSEGSDEEGSPAQALQALDHYERAISALVSTTYSGLSSPERRQLLASLCREKQRLEQADGQTGTGE